MNAYRRASQYIDCTHPLVARKAVELARGCASDEEITRNCFEFVRDAIRHSWDWRQNPVTCRASDVLLHGTGYCYAKSHLLAALLRANNIPAGLCYQRLVVAARKPRLCLHGLNAVFLREFGWYRIDARGNKPGIEADFQPPVEKLAFSTLVDGETDLPGIWAEPLEVVVRVLTGWTTVEHVHDNLPDINPEFYLETVCLLNVAEGVPLANE